MTSQGPAEAAVLLWAVSFLPLEMGISALL